MKRPKLNFISYWIWDRVMRSDVGTGEWVWIKDRINIIPSSQPNITDSSPIYPKCAGGAQCQCQVSKSWSLLRVNWQGVGIIWVRRKMIKRWNMPKNLTSWFVRLPKSKAQDIKLSCTPLLQAHLVSEKTFINPRQQQIFLVDSWSTNLMPRETWAAHVGVRVHLIPSLLMWMIMTD